MNKKIMMIISVVLSLNCIGINADAINNDGIASYVPSPLTAQQNSIYQEMVAKFKNQELGFTFNTTMNINILKQQEAILLNAIKEEASKKWLDRAAVFTVLTGSALATRNFVIIALTKKYGYEVQGFVGKIIDTLLVPGPFLTNANKAMGLPYSSLNWMITTALPVMAFYVMLKMYSSLKNKNQELETVKSMINQLATFGSAQA